MSCMNLTAFHPPLNISHRTMPKDQTSVDALTSSAHCHVSGGRRYSGSFGGHSTHNLFGTKKLQSGPEIALGIG